MVVSRTSLSAYLASTSTSMLTRSPGPRSDSVVSASVCGIRATSIPPWSSAATVNETPSTVIDPFSAQ